MTTIEARITEALTEHTVDTVRYLVTCEEYLCICGKRSDNHAAHQAAVVAGIVTEAQAEAKAPEVRYVDLTTGEKHVLDEVVAFNANVHLEAMDNNHWWMKITSGGKSVDVNLYTKRAKIEARADEEDAQ